MVGHGNPATQFGAPGGPDPVETGRKGGSRPKGVSPMDILFQRMDKKTATEYANAAERQILKGDFQHYKFLVDSHDGPVVQKVDQRISGDRTVVVSEGDGTVPPLPGDDG